MRIYMPWNNLGCFGIRFTEHVYVDIYNSWGAWGMFANVYGRKYWWTPRSLVTGKVRRI